MYFNCNSYINGFIAQFFRNALFVFILTFLCVFGNCAEENVIAKKTATSPVIDGILESAWNEAEQFTSFLNMNTELPATQKTIARLLFDEKGIYISVECLTSDIKTLKAEIAAPISKDRFPLKLDKVWQDDSVEIMLDPGITRNIFYHFVVNPNGAMFNSRKSQGGALMEKWNGDWRTASKIGTDRWTTEVFIPFYTIPLDSQVKNGWAINICRTSVNPAEYSSISTTGAYNRPRYFRRLKGIDLDLSDYMWNVSAKSQPTVRGKKKISLNYAIIKNNSTAKREIITELISSDGKDKSFSFELMPGKIKEILLAEQPLSKNQKEIVYDILVKDDNSHKELAFMHLSLIPESRLFKSRMTQPAYRDTLYSSQKIDDIRISIETLPSAKETSSWKVNGILKRSNKNIASSSLYSIKQGKTEISIPIKNLTDGEYEIVVSVFSDNKSLLDTEKIVFKKLPSLKGEAWLDANGLLFVDGKPFLPVGYMGVAIGEMEKIAKGGGNTIHNYGAYYWNQEASAKYMAEAKRLNLKVVLPPWGSIDDLQRLSTSLAPDEKERITGIVNTYKDNPNFLAWYMHDEPEGLGVPASRMREIYQLVRSLDPYHPCIMLNDTLLGLQTYTQTADIMMPDPYCMPTTRGFSEPMSKIADFMDEIKKSNPETAAWITLEAFDYGDFREYLVNNRVHTMEEFRSLSWLAINHGCKGFIHFAWPYTIIYPDLYLGIPYIFSELNALTGVVLSPNKKKIVLDKSYEGIDAIYVKLDGAIWVIVVNTLQKPRNFSLIIPELGSKELKVIGENSIVKANKGMLKDNLGDSQTRIYTTSKQNYDFNKAEVQKSIDAIEKTRRKPGNLAFWIDNGTTFKASSWVTENQYGTPRMIANGYVIEKGTEGWKNKTTEFPNWIELAWPETKEIGRVVIYAHNLKNYKLQFFKEGNWVDLKSLEGDSSLQQKTEIIFSQINTKAIRVFINSAFGEHSTISEIECYSK